MVGEERDEVGDRLLDLPASGKEEGPWDTGNGIGETSVE